MVIYEGFSLFMTGPKYFIGITQSQEHTCEGWKSSESGLYRDCDVTKTLSKARGCWCWVRKHEIKKFQTGTIRIWMLCYGHMRWQYLAGHQGQKAREAQPCSAANFHFGHRQTGGGWRQFLMKSTSGIKHISEKLNLFGTVFDPIFVFLGPGPPSQWWYWRERYTDTFIAKGGGHV